MPFDLQREVDILLGDQLQRKQITKDIVRRSNSFGADESLDQQSHVVFPPKRSHGENFQKKLKSLQPAADLAGVYIVSRGYV